MQLRVNKKTGTRRPNVKYAALSTGTVSHVWYDDETSAKTAQKRQNRIMLTRAKPSQPEASRYDA